MSLVAVTCLLALLVACEPSGLQPSGPEHGDPGARTDIPGLEQLPLDVGTARHVRCDACHGAPPPPAWAFDAGSITSVELITYGLDPLGTGHAVQDVRFDAQGRATLLLTDDALLSADELSALRSDADGTRSADFPAEHWPELAAAIAESGYFFAEEEVCVSTATHHPKATLVVSRADRADAIVVSTHDTGDESHLRYQDLVEQISAAARRLEWSLDAR